MPDILTTPSKSNNVSVDFDSLFTDKPKVSEEVTISTPSDALVYSLNSFGKVNMEYMSKLTGLSPEQLSYRLKGYIYLDPRKWDKKYPAIKGWVTKEEYLSGNIYDKYQQACNYNFYFPGTFRKNVEDLKAILPEIVNQDQIYITLGSPWLPSSIIEEFIYYLLSYHEQVAHDELTGSWHLNWKCCYNWVLNNKTYGTRRINASNIIEKTLNLIPIKITDNVGTNENPKYVTNEKETNLALEKQALIIKKFQEWVWKDPLRTKQLKNIFYQKYGSNLRRNYDGSFLLFPDLNPEISLYPYQKNAVARILFSKNTFLAHDVGSGKTFEMIAAGHELRRMGLSKKNMFVVPNNIIQQWESIYKMMYPKDNILVVTNKIFKPDKRDETLRKMKEDNYAAILIDYASFSLLKLSPRFYIDKFNELKTSLASLNHKQRTPTTNRKLSNLTKKEEDYLAAIYRELEESVGKIFFEDLNIDRLFVDEAHNFKNVPFFTKNTNLLGLNTTGSKTCEEMMDKVHYVQSKHNGGGIIFASGTPITNSIADAYILQKYLQDAELAYANISSFDAWAQNFAELKTEFEVDPTASSFRMATRLAKFHNIPELANLMANVVDFYHLDNNTALPAFNGYRDMVIPKSKELAKFLLYLSKRADLIKQYNPMIFKKGEDEIKDNMLLITTDGRKAALDLRIVDDKQYYKVYNSKVYKCAENVFNIYHKYKDTLATQIIFSDISTPKESFNIYDELKNILVSMGIPEDKIAFVQSANTDRERTKLFKKFNDGDIRILIGSTFKLGTGVNVQTRLKAIHHLDVPWRPSDMVQREGRIIRPGNTNEEVFIYRYITEHSFDAYSWQLLEMKQNFISKLLNNDVQTRSIDDIDSTVLNYAEVKALAIGDPLIKERVETFNEIQRLLGVRVKYYEQREMLKSDIINKENHLPDLYSDLEKAQKDYEYTKTLEEHKWSMEEKKAFGQDVLNNIFVSNNEDKETHDLEFRGFKIITVPFIDDKRFIYLERKNRYRLDVADSNVGIAIRLDNFISDFIKRVTAIESRINETELFIKEGKEELSKSEDYTKRIEKLKKKLEALDKKLGVNKDETTN